MASNALALRVRAYLCAYGRYLHHKYFECNYGGGARLLVFDILFGTSHDGSDEAHERMNKRLEERRWAEQAAVG